MNTEYNFTPIIGELNIILAEDDKTDCLFFKEALDELPLSANLTIVNDGEQLLNLLQQPNIILPDVIFLDLNMPKKNGFAALAAIKNNSQLQHIPIIIFSTTNKHHIDKIKIEQVFKDAAHYYIRKPSQFAALKKVLHKALAIIANKNVSLPKQKDFVLVDKIKAEENYTNTTLDEIIIPSLLLDSNINVKIANKAFCEIFHLNKKEVEGLFIGDFDNHQWNIPKLIACLKKIISEKYILNNFELTYTKLNIGTLALLLSAKQIVDINSFEKLILLFVENITVVENIVAVDIDTLKIKTPIVICTEQKKILENELEKTKLKLAETKNELLIRSREGEKRAAELIIANIELIFQNTEKEKRAAELAIADKELIFQSLEKEKRASELIIAVKELIFQNEEKEKRAAELILANKKFILQSQEKEKRASELTVANKELVFQNKEKEKRAAEVNIANKELIFQNEEKEKRAAELNIANKELIFQNEEKEKRAAELIIANKELIFQNEEKEKRATELISINKELEAFAYISSHDLQEPLRKIQMFSGIILEKEQENLSDKGKNYFRLIEDAANRMQTLIEDLLTFSRLNKEERKFENTNLSCLVDAVKVELKDALDAKNATIKVTETGTVNIIIFQFQQLLHNIISNALKFSNPKHTPEIVINSRALDNAKFKNPKLAANKIYCHITITDNGIGFDPIYSEKIFEVFQKLHSKEEYSGTGIGLAIVKKIVENHNGIVTAIGELNQGARFDIYIPNN